MIAAAKGAFAKDGAAVSLEQIARDADVSIATLYRHFPTRDELISAVYQQEVTTLIEAADQLMSKREPAAALREWLMLFVDFLDAKHGMAEAMDTLIGGPEPLYSKTPHRLDVPVKALVAGGVADWRLSRRHRAARFAARARWRGTRQAEQELEAVGSSDGRPSPQRLAGQAQGQGWRAPPLGEGGKKCLVHVGIPFQV